jgi:hypothetical protein
MKWFAPLLFVAFTACRAESNDLAANPKKVEPGVLLVGEIEHPRITESSGITASRKDASVFWTHNDGGGKRQVLYAMTRHGKPIADFRVTGATIEDWEDIAVDDKGNLFLADSGNNDLKRTSIAVHQVEEPDTKETQTGLVRVIRSWNLRYPSTRFDCESLFIWSDHGYLISKVFKDQRADIYRFSLTNSAPFQTLEPVGEVRIDSPVTGADISRDGSLIGILAKNGAYVYRIDGDVTRATQGKPYQNKFKHNHVEGCAFVPEGLLVTAESREIFLFDEEPFRTGPPKKK